MLNQVVSTSLTRPEARIERFPSARGPISYFPFTHPMIRLLLLLRLFQHTPICSVGVCPAQLFPRVSASFSANSPPKTPANSIWRRAVGRTDSCVSAVGAGTRMCSSTGDVPCAVETERRLGSRLRNHFRRLAEPELRVARSERRHQLRHVLAAVHAPKALGGFQHPGRDPA